MRLILTLSVAAVYGVLVSFALDGGIGLLASFIGGLVIGHIGFNIGRE